MIKKCSKKTFVTLFARGADIHLIKDVGTIPYLMGKNHNYDSYLVCYKNSSEYTNLKFTDGLKLDFMKKCSNKYFDSMIYLIHNSKKIDVLNLYHLRPFAELMIIIYKFFNPKGKVFLKLDNGYFKHKNCSIIHNKIFIKWIISKCSLVSCESRKASELFKNDGLNIEYIPNGFISYKNYDDNKKENYILTVGRLGTEQKATEILLDSFKILKEKYKSKYKLYMIGSMEENFKKKYEFFLKENPKLKKDIIYVGELNDKVKLDEYYNKCKIFCLPSRYESFGLVLVEAMAHGCYIVTTKFGAPVYDIVFDDKIGSICDVDDSEMIAKAIYDFSKKNNENLDYRIEFAKNNFDWEVIVENINNYLDN